MPGGLPREGALGNWVFLESHSVSKNPCWLPPFFGFGQGGPHIRSLLIQFPVRLSPFEFQACNTIPSNWTVLQVAEGFTYHRRWYGVQLLYPEPNRLLRPSPREGFHCMGGERQCITLEEIKSCRLWKSQLTLLDLKT